MAKVEWVEGRGSEISQPHPQHREQSFPRRRADWDKSSTDAAVESSPRDREIKAAGFNGGLSINSVLVSFGREFDCEFNDRLCNYAVM